jgi:hypothetical protein
VADPAPFMLELKRFISISEQLLNFHYSVNVLHTCLLQLLPQANTDVGKSDEGRAHYLE